MPAHLYALRSCMFSRTEPATSLMASPTVWLLPSATGEDRSCSTSSAPPATAPRHSLLLRLLSMAARGICQTSSVFPSHAKHTCASQRVCDLKLHFVDNAIGLETY